MPIISTNIFFRKDDGIKIFDHQASSSKAVARKCSVKITQTCPVKKCSQKFRKIESRKPVSDAKTVPFLSFLQNFQEHLFYWTPPMVAFSNFKASGFTEAVMQMNFWITHDLPHLSILSSSWHFCVYLRQAQAFCCIATASLTLDILYYFWQRRIEITWYLNQPISFCANLYRINHRVTSILLRLWSIGLMKLEI